MSKNNVIGAKNRLPWHLPADLARFTKITTGHPVIMGSNTYESIPSKSRPLSGRTNIVLTRNHKKRFSGVKVVHSLAEALQLAATCPGGNEVMIIGGGQIFELALPLVNRIYLTLIDCTIKEGDTFFPPIDLVRFKGKKSGEFQKDEANEFSGEFIVYERTGIYPIAEPSNGRTQVYKDRLKEIMKSGVCPFCPHGATHQDEEILYSNESWFVKNNPYPLENALYHFMITPHRHILSVDEISSEEWNDFKAIRRWLSDRYAMLGDVLYMRSGDPLVTGATVAHFHCHIIVPTNMVNVVFGKFIS